MTRNALCLALALGAPLHSAASAAPKTYELDPSHTFPSFEADHMGMSRWRGKFNRTTGTVLLDREAGRGTVEVQIDLDSIDYGLDEMNAWARGEAFFDTAKYPRAIYRGELRGFNEGKPAELAGELTMRGITRPVTLKIHAFNCRPHPVFKRDWCGADAVGSFDREAFGLAAGKDWGFDMNVTLRIQVEAVLREDQGGKAAASGR